MPAKEGTDVLRELHALEHMSSREPQPRPGAAAAAECEPLAPGWERRGRHVHRIRSAQLPPPPPPPPLHPGPSSAPLGLDTL